MIRLTVANLHEEPTDTGPVFSLKDEYPIWVNRDHISQIFQSKWGGYTALVMLSGPTFTIKENVADVLAIIQGH